MELKDQVCSYNQSVRLSELGVELKSLNSWFIGHYDDAKPYLCKFDNFEIGHNYSAYTVAELMEMLPAKIVKNGFDYRLKTKKTLIGYRVSYNVTRAITNSPHLGFSLKPPGENFAHVLADMLIYLLENKHINPEDLK